MPSWSMIREAEMPASPASALANVVIDDASTLYLDGREHRIEHQPAAHTAGDLAIFLPEENVLFTGDVVSIERLVLADSRAGGSLKGLIEAHQRFIELSDAETVVVPGHGELTNREALVKSVEFLLTIRERLMAAQEAGVEFADLDPDAIFASTGLGAQLEDPVRVNLFLREAYSALQPQRARLHL